MCLRNKLKVGDRVRTKKFHSVYGEIIEIDYTMYKIEIDNPVNNWTINNWYEWNSDIQSARLNGELKPGTTFNWNNGGNKITSTLHTVTPFKEIGWSGKAFGAFAIHNFTITADNGFTTVLIEESMEGLLMRFFRGYMQNTLEGSINKWLTQLKETAENI